MLIARSWRLLLAFGLGLGIPSSEAQFQGDFVVTGATSRPGHSYELRLNVLDMFYNNHDQFSVLVLALLYLQNMNHTLQWSYHNFANLHGMPWGKPGTGVNTGERCLGCGNSGYALHNSTGFLPWHRVYTAAFEQQLQICAKIVVKNSDSYWQNLATTLRVPYWDWSLPTSDQSPRLPWFFTVPTLEVTNPDYTINPNAQNPLYSFSLPAGLAFGDQTATVRWPSGDNDTLYSHWNYEAELGVGGLRKWATSMTYSTWTTSGGDFNKFGTMFSADPEYQDGSASLEHLHNTVHLAVGGTGIYGTMAIITRSTYDPIFWFHHANVDRLYTLFQGFYPDKLMVPAPCGSTSFTYLAGTTIDMNTPLRPFVQANGEDWTPNTAWATSNFGYKYAEFESPSLSNPAELQSRTIIVYANGTMGNYVPFVPSS